MDLPKERAGIAGKPILFWPLQEPLSMVVQYDDNSRDVVSNSSKPTYFVPNSIWIPSNAL